MAARARPIIKSISARSASPISLLAPSFATVAISELLACASSMDELDSTVKSGTSGAALTLMYELGRIIPVAPAGVSARWGIHDRAGIRKRHPAARDGGRLESHESPLP